jgi:helicase
MTPERLDAITRSWRSHWQWLPQVDLLVVDELHLLGDPHRGPRLEGTLSRFRRLNPFARLLGLSATLGNRAELADWLDGVHYVSDSRPIPLQWRFVNFRRATDKPDLLAHEVKSVVQARGKSLVFVQSRRRAEDLSRYLCGVGLRAAHHHAGLDHDARSQVESGFGGSEVDVLVATSTLEMGLNLPVRQVVLYDLQAFDGSEFRQLSVNSVWQRVGRAGRRGLDEVGEGVLFCPQWDRDAERYPRAPFDPIVSGLFDRAMLAEQIVTEVGAGMARTRRQLQRMLGLSLAARQGRLRDVDGTVQSMCDAGMLTEVTDDSEQGQRRLRLKVTRIGRVAVRHLLTPATVARLRVIVSHPEPLTMLDLLLAAASTDDCEPVIPVDFEELAGLADRLARERSTLLRLDRHTLVDVLGVDAKRLLAAIHMALVARDWTRLGDAEAVADHHGCYPFEVKRLRESLLRLIAAMSEIAAAQADSDTEQRAQSSDEPFRREMIDALGRMIAGGLDEQVVTLTYVAGIGPRTARCLRDAGVGDIEDLAAAEPDDVALRLTRVSNERLGKWIDEAESLLKTRSAFRLRETGVGPIVPLSSWPTQIDAYRLRRAIDLHVEAIGAREWVVTGGLEPHRVTIANEEAACDCGDAARGNRCKHALAVGIYAGDATLRHLANRLTTASTGTLDLTALWFGRWNDDRRRLA